ncbi:hypothetical protein ACU5DF_02790 [Aliivibrio wodanis]|uniref:hypothetical protein n=1 Tax=Aliivibrio wodanis TaxID=80852 RepID=UPI00406CF125
MKNSSDEDILPKGECPWCKKQTHAYLAERNVPPRRNIYRCGEKSCDKQVLVCYSPGCDDLARWGDIWDDFYCPDCTSQLGPLSTVGKFLGFTSKVKKPKW